MSRHIQVYPDRPSLLAAAADMLIAAAQQAIAERGRWTWVLAGGSTPEGTYQRMAQTPEREQVDWQRVWVFWGDERCVAPTDAASNYRMAQRALLEHVAIPPEQVLRMRGELDPQQAAHAYAEAMQAACALKPDQLPSFDTILLGMGADGHTASLFPGTTLLEEHERLVVAGWVEQVKQQRISLSLPVLNAARQVLFLVAGKDKAAVVAAVLRGETDYPAAQVRSADQLIWLLDAEAASALPADQPF